ncbi:predicted protein [Naegleria gruberi]|uniref:Predicted protein n=1 Tax=Naegleria gruberi TaxID=5762 RepID=D2VZ40_NAEGR|nr:uncharacterized protein NAEGRDRAFT_74349 [Naegleria gruberi]EFC37925.1 predicted protein [Naegleria gruberi]|eukprot:XP_002670669.1 predicted protein [Naegleria gruberi strain NEG-M]
MLLKLYIWLDQTVTIQPNNIFQPITSDYSNPSTNETFTFNQHPFMNNILVNNAFQPIPESPPNTSSFAPQTCFISAEKTTTNTLQDSKKRKHNESFPFVCHTVESMKEEEERKKAQPKRPRGRPRKHSFDDKLNDTSKRIKHIQHQ